MWQLLDPYLLRGYRLTGVGWLDGLIGTFLIALAAILVGEFTIWIVFKANRRHLFDVNENLRKYSELSQEALRRGDERSYKALNRQANDAYGHVFFNNFGLSAASLWPAFFALDWMQRHFSASGVSVPFFPEGVNYVAVFLTCYILARIFFRTVRPHLPYFKQQHKLLVRHEGNNHQRLRVPSGKLTVHLGSCPDSGQGRPSR